VHHTPRPDTSRLRLPRLVSLRLGSVRPVLSRCVAAARFGARVGVAVAVLTLLILGPATPAAAHTVGGVGATNFHTSLSALSPAVPGLDLHVIENGSRLELSNATPADVIVAGYGGEPYARIGPRGAFLNDNSPATYLNADRYSSTPVPTGVDPKAAPRWRRVSTAPTLAWHDHRVHWMLPTLPASIAADPGSPHRISSWTVVLSYAPTAAGTGGQRLVATGTLDWVPGPSPAPWLLLAVAVAAGVAALAYLRRPQRVLAAATAALVVFDVFHGLGVMLITVGSLPQRLGALFGADALLIWPFGLLAAALLWRRLTRAGWLAAAVGAIIAVTIAVDDAPDLWRSSSPTLWPVGVNRAAVALVMGIGLGLVVALPVLLRRHVPRSPRPWTLPAALAASAVSASNADGSTTAADADGSASVASPVDSTVPATDMSTVEHGGSGGVGRRQAAGFLAAGALGALAGTAAGIGIGGAKTSESVPSGPGLADVGARRVPFYGPRQAGIGTPNRPQAHLWVAGFDLADGVDRAALQALLRRWTDAAARLTAGQPLGAADDSVTAGIGPAALTVTVGFGPSLFGRAGIAASARPDGLAPLPAFAGERLDPARGDGDLGLVIAADDAIVLAHAARVLGRLAAGVAQPRWQQSGFNAARGSTSDSATPRNLMGQVDGSNNPKPADPDFATRIFAVAPSAPAWLDGGSYLVVRRIRMLLDDWDTVAVAEQERVIGRRKDNGAPLSGGQEHTAADYGARAPDGSFAIPADAHIRLATPAFNNGAAILRRGFSYVDGTESGLLFLAWQADPRRGFIPIQQNLVRSDALGRFIRHETSALFAMPGGVAEGGYLGQRLMDGS
jgi:deferrochelatase/peroxidase EfeB